jgi:hypothetical protein
MPARTAWTFATKKESSMNKSVTSTLQHSTEKLPTEAAATWNDHLEAFMCKPRRSVAALRKLAEADMIGPIGCALPWWWGAGLI